MTDTGAALALRLVPALLLVLSACSASPAVSPTPLGSGPPTAFPSSSVTVATDPPSPTSTPAPTASPPATASPTASPAPTPTATPHPAPTAAPTTAAASRAVSHGSRTTRQVALTYDMGGRVGDALAIVGWLVDHRVPATIFMTGEMAATRNTDAGRQVLAVVEGHPELFTLGNHSYSHPDFTTLDASQIRDQLTRTAAAFTPYCSQDPRPLFRPPFGAYDGPVLAAVGAAGYADTILWDVDTIDWRAIANDPPGPTADQIVAKVLANAQGGSIVLNHLGGYETYAALPRVVSGLQARGFELVTLDEMLGT